MHDNNFSLELASQLVESSEQFPVDFDLLWQWCGYSRKNNAKRVLLKNFEIDIEYRLLNIEQTKADGTYSHKVEQINLTVDCAKEFALLAQTSNGKVVRKYFVEAEKQLRSILESDRASLERTLAKDEPIKVQKEKLSLIGDAYDLFKKAYGDAYAYRYLHQQTHKHLPEFAGDEPLREERPSLPAKVLLTPTEIASRLNINRRAFSFKIFDLVGVSDGLGLCRCVLRFYVLLNDF